MLPSAAHNSFSPPGYQLLLFSDIHSTESGLTMEHLTGTQPWQQDPAMQGLLAQIDPACATPWCQVTSVNLHSYGHNLGFRVGDLFVEHDSGNLRLIDLERALLHRNMILYHKKTSVSIICKKRGTAHTHPTPHVAHQIQDIPQPHTFDELPFVAPLFALPPILQIVSIQFSEDDSLSAVWGVDPDGGAPWDHFPGNLELQFLLPPAEEPGDPEWCEVFTIDEGGYGFRSGLRLFDLFVETRDSSTQLLNANEVDLLLSRRPVICHVMRPVPQENAALDRDSELIDHTESFPAPYFLVPPTLQIVPIQITEEDSLSVHWGVDPHVASWEHFPDNHDIQFIFSMEEGLDDTGWCEVLSLNEGGYGF